MESDHIRDLDANRYHEPTPSPSKEGSPAIRAAFRSHLGRGAGVGRLPRKWEGEAPAEPWNPPKNGLRSLTLPGKTRNVPESVFSSEAVSSMDGGFMEKMRTYRDQRGGLSVNVQARQRDADLDARAGPRGRGELDVAANRSRRWPLPFDIGWVCGRHPLRFSTKETLSA